MKSLHSSMAHTIRYLLFLVRQLTGANAHLYQKYYSASRYSARKMPQILAGLFEPSGQVVFPAATGIGFGGVPFGSDEETVRARLGQPECVRRDDGEGYAHRILFYREDVGGYETRESVSLLDGKLFYGCHDFSRGPLLGRNDVRTIRQSLIGKYLDGDAARQAVLLDRFRIVDREGNLVVFSNSVTMTISYYHGDPALKGRLKTLYDALMEESRRKLRLKQEALAGRL